MTLILTTTKINPPAFLQMWEPLENGYPTFVNTGTNFYYAGDYGGCSGCTKDLRVTGTWLVIGLVV